MGTLKEADKNKTIWFGKNGNAVPRLKKYLNEMKQGVIPKTIWLYDEVGSNDEAKKDYKNIFPENGFATPKPVRLLKTIIKLASNENDFVLDSFAGSGTTGHAVLDLNKKAPVFPERTWFQYFATGFTKHIQELQIITDSYDLEKSPTACPRAA